MASGRKRHNPLMDHNLTLAKNLQVHFAPPLDAQGPSVSLLVLQVVDARRGVLKDPKF